MYLSYLHNSIYQLECTVEYEYAYQVAENHHKHEFYKLK